MFKEPSPIGHFKDTVTLFVYPLKSCISSFQFLLGLTMVPRENKKNGYANFWRTSKEYYGIEQPIDTSYVYTYLPRRA